MSDLADKSEAELDQMMRQMTSGQPIAAEPAPPAEPEPAVQEEQQTDQAKPTEEAAAPAETAEPTIEDLEKKDRELELEELRSKMKHLESVNGRLAGEIGFLRQKAATRPAPEPDYEATRQEEEVPARTPSRDNLVTWNIQQAIGQAGAAFQASHPDFEELKKHITEKHGEGLQEQVASLLTLDDPLEAYKQASAIMDAIYYRAKNERVAIERAENQAKMTERKAEQSRKLADAKKKAASSGNGSTPSPTPTPKALKDMSFEEVDALLKQLPR